MTELQLGKYEFYPNDRLLELIEELLSELRRRRSGLEPFPTDEELEHAYKEQAEYEAANPDFDEWKD